MHNDHIRENAFWREHFSSGLKACVLSGGITCIVLGVLTAVVTGVVGLIDALLMIGLGIGIVFRRSRACAVFAGIYYALSQLLVRLTWLGALQTANTQTIVYAILLMLILSIYGTFTFRVQYRDYQAKKAAEVLFGEDKDGGDDTDGEDKWGF